MVTMPGRKEKQKKEKQTPSDEGAFFKKISSYILTNEDYEDPSRVFPIKEDERKPMRSCRRCWVLYDNSCPAGECYFHKSFYRLAVPPACVGLIIGKEGKNVRPQSLT